MSSSVKEEDRAKAYTVLDCAKAYEGDLGAFEGVSGHRGQKFIPLTDTQEKCGVKVTSRRNNYDPKRLNAERIRNLLSIV